MLVCLFFFFLFVSVVTARSSLSCLGSSPGGRGEVGEPVLLLFATPSALTVSDADL